MGEGHQGGGREAGRSMRLRGLFICLALASGTAGAQSAPASYPAKPIRMIISFVPGGPNDIVGRALARRLEESLSQTVIVDNRGGANGTLGTALAARTAPDGYTVLIGSLGTLGISPSIYPKLGYDAIRDFEHIAMIAVVANLLVVHPTVPAKSLKALIALARKNPGKLNYGSVGGTSHLMAEMLNSAAQISTVHVPYKGAAPALVGLIGGEVDFFVNPFPGLWPHVKSGKLRALAITTDKRSRFAPEVPTMGESGLPGYSAATWFSLEAPAGTPREIVARLNQAVMKALRTPEMLDSLNNMNAEPVMATAEQTAEFIRNEIPKWAKAVKAAGVKPE
ncbi:MAG: tctC [Betaproteobacteria bacterium]|jgi:tripartite-type tricarboxylate transporter receptor subunit TctC|nr:tctC [Betaproteobacteria bacterium]